MSPGHTMDSNTDQSVFAVRDFLRKGDVLMVQWSLVSGDQPNARLAILALALLLAGCEGDRIKGMNEPQAQPQSTVLT